MKNIKILVLLLPTVLFAQQRTTNVYDKQYGLKGLVPTQVVVESAKKTEVYNTVNGMREITPAYTIQKNEVYKVDRGLRSITPIKRLEIQTVPPKRVERKRFINEVKKLEL